MAATTLQGKRIAFLAADGVEGRHPYR